MRTVRELTVAVVGLGDFGLRYVSALAAQPAVRVGWGCDPDGSRHAPAVTAGAERCTAEFAEVLADPDVDAVVVATPEAAHREVAVAAMHAGRHVVVEKPLATRDEDGVAMVEAARDTGRLLLPAFLLRFDYRYAQVRQRLAEIAPVRSAYAHRNFDRRLFQTYGRTHSFVENAIHDIDLLLWYLGGEVAAAHGFCRTTGGGGTNPDVNWGVLEFDSGAVAVLQTSWLYPEQAHRNLQWNAGIQLMGDRGVLEVANDRGGLRANTTADGILLLDQTGWADIHGEARGAFGAMIRHFVACLRGDATPAGTTPDEALASMRIARRLVDDAAARPAPPGWGQP